MKFSRSALTIIIILGVTAAVLGLANKKNVPVSTDIDLSPNINAEQLCYIWNTEAGDKAQLSMDIRAANVIGEFYFLPAEKDKKTGIFKGTVSLVDPKTMNRTVNAIWDASGEGMQNREELRIIFNHQIATVGFGEMKKRVDGVYVYADPAKISYAPNLQQTDCGDNAMD